MGSADECGYSHELGQGGGKGNERSSGIENDARIIELSSLAAEADGIEVDLPVGLAPQWDLGHLASVVRLVDATEDDLGFITLGVGVTEIEGENLLVHEFLINHLVEGRHDLVDADGIVAETEDAIKPTEGKSKTGLFGGLGEVLLLNGEIANGDGVLRHDSAQAAGTILDGEL